MTALMAYRGPDDTGVYEDGEIVLGNRRLSVLDLSAAGHQPMVADDGELALTFNGEIYNFRALRRELEARGRTFRTETDTEVVLEAYRAWGSGCLSRLEGMFGLALWDRRSGELLLARDRLGIKPLFYWLGEEGALAFASELKPMLLVPGLEPRVSRPALRSAIRYASNLEEESMLATVFKLPPGHSLRWHDGRVRREAYWTHPAVAPEPWREAELVEELRKRLRGAVASHMVSDAPLGAALSGGLDSSAVVALMAEAAGGSNVRTFTVGHGDDDPDLIAARRVAEHCGTDHREILVGAADAGDLLPTIVWHMEEPLGHMECVQLYATYREAARFVKVLLIGEGADECFAGYARYRLLQPGLPVPRSLRKELYQRVYLTAAERPRSLPGRAAARLLWGRAPASPLPDPLPSAALPQLDTNHLLESALSHDQRTYLHHLVLKRADSLGMAHSVELRVPFLDRGIVELAARIPAGLLMRRRTEKYVLRRAAEQWLPPEIVRRRKRPLQMRLDVGLASTLEGLCAELLRSADVRARGFFDPRRVEALLRGRPGLHASADAHRLWANRVWAMLLVEVWARVFLDRPPGSGPPARLADLG